MALVARARRELLLGVHRFRLRREDLEDAYSQATLELIAQARGGGRFASHRHLANVLEQRFLSRIHDRRRALSGRSPMQAALEEAAALDGVGEQLDVADAQAELEQLVLLREELRRIRAVAHGLTPEQRLVIATQVALQMGCAEFCLRFGWSAEKYRKVAQRGRSRLKALVAESDGDGARASRVPVAEGLTEERENLPMTISPPTHGRVLRDADDRLNGRSHGDAHPRASGRDPELPPLRLPVARVKPRSVG